MNQVELLSRASDGLDSKETGRDQDPGRGARVVKGVLDKRDCTTLMGARGEL